MLSRSESYSNLVFLADTNPQHIHPEYSLAKHSIYSHFAFDYYTALQLKRFSALPTIHNNASL